MPKKTRVITRSGNNVFSDGKLAGQYRSPEEAAAAAAEYASLGGSIAGDTGGAAFRASRPGAMRDAAAFAAERAKQAGMGAPQSMNAEAAQRQGLETPEQTMARTREKAGPGAGPSAQLKPAPAVFTSSRADRRDQRNMEDYQGVYSSLQENLKNKKTPAAAGAGADTVTTAEPTGTGTSGTMTSADAVNAQITDAWDQYEQRVAGYQQKIDSIISGTYDLSPDETAQLQSVQASIDRSLEEQRKTNDAQLAAVRRLGIRSGRQRYASEINQGNLGAEISAGTKRIADLQSSGLSLLNQAKQAMVDKDMEYLNTAMENYRQVTKDRADTIQNMSDNVIQYERLAMDKADAEQKRMDEEQKAYDETVAASREGSILGMIARGITDPLSIVSAINYDENGNPVGNPVTVKQVADIQKALADAKADPTKTEVRAGSDEGLYSITYDEDGNPTGVKELLAPAPPKQTDALDGAPASYKEWTLAGQPGTYQEWLKSSDAKPPTQAQYTVGGYAVRTEDASRIIDSLSDYVSGLNAVKFSTLEKSPNFLRSAEFQQFDQARRDFINAVLRKESGAVISDSEFANARKQYFPEPGDSPDLLAQKKRAREIATNNLIRQSGPAYAELSPNALKGGTGQEAYDALDPSVTGGMSYDEVVSKYGDDFVRELIESNSQDFSEDLSTSGNGSIGSLSERYESGGNPGAIGNDSTGGWSYGTYQLAHQNARKFVEQSGYADQFKGLEFNSPEWREKWKQVASSDPEGFGAEQKSYIARTHFAPQIRKLADAGIDTKSLSPVVLDAIWSTAVQHGANTGIVLEALRKSGDDPAEQLRNIYAMRWNGGKGFASSTPAVRKSVYDRFFGPQGELNTALKQLA